MGEEEQAALSDDEIEALLSEEDDTEDDPGSSGGGGDSFDSDDLIDTYRELSESVQNVLSTILNRDASQSVESLGLISPEEVSGELEDQPETMVIITSELSGAVEGTARYLLGEQDALLLADVMMGQEGDNPPDEFDEVYESAIVEMFNQVVNSLANQINELTGETIELSAPESEVVNREDVAELIDDERLWVEYAFEVEGLIDSGHFIEVQPGSLGEMIWNAQQEELAEPEPKAEPEPEPELEPSGQRTQKQPSGQSPGADKEQAEVQSVEFPQFEATEGEQTGGSLNMLMDVPMEVSVQLGRTKLQVKEILNLGQGSIIELERLAGEPVDLLVNGRLVARGEVVVIDESFGVRVTSIVSPMDRIK